MRKIYSSMQGNLGAWQNYVDEHLLPRLNGFEFMMAPYAIAHLKLDMVLSETGYVPKKNKRLRIYLTNSLEECDPNTGTLFAQWLAQEAAEANLVKRDTPVMVMIGNPPYSGESSNNGSWIMNLMNDYKREPNSKNSLQERNPKWINDDYCKFIRLAQYYIDKNENGIVAYINNHSFLDNPTFRGMRWSLLSSFDEIYILDLHGNSKKKEVAPDGSKDENVFDIMQGVSINIFVKKRGQKCVIPSDDSCHSRNKHGGVIQRDDFCHSRPDRESPLARVFHYELYGKRSEKYHYLKTHSIKDVPWQELNPQAPQYFFVPKSDVGKDEYEKGFAVNELITCNTMGITTGKDKILVNENAEKLLQNVKDAYGHSDVVFVKKEQYRPFDNRFIYYDVNKLARARESLAKNFEYLNIGLCLIRINSRDEELTIFVTDKITDKTILSSKDNANVFPLYLYPTEDSSTPSLQLSAQNTARRKPNLDETIWHKIDACLVESMDPIEASPLQGDNFSHKTSPEQIFDYIYGVLHTPSYRERYKEFLKIDFPRIPYPQNAEEFNRIAAIGGKLRKLHLMQEIPQPLTVLFNTPGDNMVSEVRYEVDPIGMESLQGDKWVERHSGATNGSDRIHDYVGKVGKVFINKTQYFENVPELAWNFFIGGYQPAQKWLKDRKNRTLTYDDIEHYRKIIAILVETHNLMQELEKVH